MTQIALIDEVRGALTKMAPEFQKALPKHVSVDKFQRVVMTSFQQNPDILNADRRTLFMACTRAAQMGLLPDGREGAIVKYGNQAQFLPMVAGLMKMVRQSGEISAWSVQTVHENDEFDYEMGDNEFIRHKPALKNRGELVGAYSIVTLKDGEKSREFMNADEVEAIRKRSRSGNSGPWQTDKGEMYKKTAVRRHVKRLPLSTDLDVDFHEDEIPGETPAPVTAPPAETAKRKSRLQAAVEPAQDDDVIDVGGTPTPEAPHESPV